MACFLLFTVLPFSNGQGVGCYSSHSQIKCIRVPEGGENFRLAVGWQVIELAEVGDSVSHVGRYENGIPQVGPFFERGREQRAEGSVDFHIGFLSVRPGQPTAGFGRRGLL
jgi:hypothetical protein